jgi:hypothetical protein
MAKQQQQHADPQVGDTMFYFAHETRPGAPYSGPHVARVTKVNPAKEEDNGPDPASRHPAEPLTVNLDVRFSAEETIHKKTGVRVVQSPERYCCTRTPADFDFDQFIKELSKEPEPAAEPAP